VTSPIAGRVMKSISPSLKVAGDRVRVKVRDTVKLRIRDRVSAT
jgi:hypothetical protein